MSAQIVIISPELPPIAGGLADHTAIVVSHWPRIADLRFIVPRRPGVSYATVSDYPIIEIDRTRTALAARLPASGGAVLLQYSAYGYDRLGYPRWVLEALLDWKQHSRGRLCVMFHEIWTFWPWWNKNFAVQMFHRRALKRLLQVADAVFTTTASQAEYLSVLKPNTEVRVLPVGANIAPASDANNAPERGTAIVFGMQATRCRALRLMRESLGELAKTNRLTKIITAGAGDSPSGDADERALLDSLGLTSAFEQLGSKPAPEISALLSRAEFGIAVQDHLSYTKSGTFMAYAAHGTNILSPFANPAAQEPMSLLINPADLKAVTDAELWERGIKLRAWYGRTASWPRIADEFAHALRLGEANAVAK